MNQITDEIENFEIIFNGVKKGIGICHEGRISDI